MSRASTAVGSLAVAALVGGYSYWRSAAFLRDPDREPPADPTSVVSAADGYITYVKRVEAGEVPIAVKKRRSIRLSEYAGVDASDVGRSVHSEASGWLIGTYMTEHSVHRNRAPVAGRVVLREHRGAAPFNRSMARMTANLFLHRTPYDDQCDYLLTNERLTIGVQHDTGPVVFVTQIADLWVDRIVAHVGVGDRLERGEQYGLIRFGSQCDVFLPDAILDGGRESVLVSPGQYVWAGESVLARARPAGRTSPSGDVPEIHEDLDTRHEVMS